MFFPLRTKLKAYFVTGLLTVIPFIIVVAIAGFIIKTGGNLLISIPPISLIFQKFQFPGLKLVGFILATVVVIGLIVLAGVFTAHIAGKRIVTWMENSLLLRIPLVKQIYLASKQLMELLFINQKKVFSKVVLVEYPRKGVYAVGFVTADGCEKLATATQKKVVNLYIPTALNLASGFLLITPEDEVIPLDITVEQGLKLVISGGVLLPTIASSTKPKLN